MSDLRGTVQFIQVLYFHKFPPLNYLIAPSVALDFTKSVVLPVDDLKFAYFIVFGCLIFDLSRRIVLNKDPRKD